MSQSRCSLKPSKEAASGSWSGCPGVIFSISLKLFGLGFLHPWLWMADLGDLHSDSAWADLEICAFGVFGSPGIHQVKR